MSHLWKKVNVACFNSCPMKCSSSDCYGSSDSLLHARLTACHETLRHKDARHSHANRISTLSDKMRLFSAIEIIPGERSCCVSAVLKSILHFCTSKKKKKKENARYNRKGSQLPVFTYRAEGLLIIHIIHSPPPWMCFSVRGDMNCLLGCSLK